MARKRRVAHLQEGKFRKLKNTDLFFQYWSRSRAYWSGSAVAVAPEPVPFLVQEDPDADLVALQPVSHHAVPAPSKLVTDQIAPQDVRNLFVHLATVIGQVNAARGPNATKIGIPSEQQFQDTILPALIRRDMGLQELRRVMTMLVEYRYESRKRREEADTLPITRGTCWQYLVKLVQLGTTIDAIDEIMAMRQRFVQANPGKIREILEDYCGNDPELFHDFWDHFDAVSGECRSSKEIGICLTRTLRLVDQLGSVESWIAGLESGEVKRWRRPKGDRMTQLQRLRYEVEPEGYYVAMAYDDRYRTFELRQQVKDERRVEKAVRMGSDDDLEADD